MERTQPDEFETTGLPRAFRGYERSAVDKLMQQAASELEAQRAEIAQLKDQVSKLESTLSVHKSQENTLHEALMAAQRSADETRTNALRQADAIVEEARKRAVQIEAELQTRLNDLRWEYEKIAIDKQRFTERFRSLLEEYLASLVVESSQFRERPLGNGGSRKSAAATAVIDNVEGEIPETSKSIPHGPNAVIQDPIEVPDHYHVDG